MEATDDAGATEEERLAALLVAYDEALARGAIRADSSALTATDPHTMARYRRARSCLNLLERAWPRVAAEAVTPPGPGPLGPGLDPAGGPGRFGRFLVLRELGRGGGGVVWLAFDPSMRRKVALKVPRLGALVTPELRRRFLREAQAAGGLDHPNLVPVYEAGEVGPVCYLAAAYCPGQSLAEWLREGPGPVAPRLAAELALRLAEAVAHAHGRGILHRDIKPANVLLERPGTGPGAVADLGAVPRLTDFGLARPLDEAPGETRLGAVVGTPQYMAPEQAEGEGRPVGPPADVYALGALLYELLTGRVPLRGGSDAETLRLVLAQEPPGPRRLRPEVPRDLDTIARKCLEKDPRRRYGSARALADDLRRYLDGRPILARPAGPVERARKWARRQPGVAAALAAVILAAALGFGGVTWQWRRAEAARHDLEASLYLRLVALADRELADGREARARDLLARCAPELRHWEWHHLSRLRAGAARALGGHAGAVLAVAFAPDGTRLASAGADGAIRLSDPADGRPLRTLRGHRGPVFALAFAPDGRLASAGEDGTVRLWDVAAREARLVLSARQGAVFGLAVSADGARLASGGGDGTVRIWDVATGRATATLRGHADRVTGVAFAPDGRLVASCGDDRTVRLWDLAEGRERVEGRRAAMLPATRLTFRPDGRQLAWALRDGTIATRDLAAPGAVRVLDGHGDVAWDLAYSPDGRRLASAGWDRTVRLWDVATGQEALTLSGHPDLVWSVAFSPDGRRIASAGGSGALRIWDSAPVDPTAEGGPRSLDGHERTVRAVAYSPDGRRLVSAGDDGTVRIWDAATGRPGPALRGHAGGVLCARFSPDGRLVATAGWDRTIRLWDGSTGRAGRVLPGHAGTIQALAFAPDGATLASAGWDRAVRVWDLGSGELLRTLGGRCGPLYALAYSPDGRHLAAAGADRVIRLWETATGRAVRTLLGHADLVRAVAFSPDGRFLASTGADGSARIWDAADGRELHRLDGHGDRLTDVAFAPDGTRLATAGWDATIRIWDPADGDLLAIVPSHAVAFDLAFAPDSRHLAAAGADRVVRLWPSSP